MLKRSLIFVFILSAVTLLAMAPMSASSISENNPKRQDTVEPTVVEPTIDPGVTIAVETPDDATPTPAFVPNTGNDGTSTNTMVIYALLAILAIAVVVGGVALINRRQI